MRTEGSDPTETIFAFYTAQVSITQLKFDATLEIEDSKCEDVFTHRGLCEGGTLKLWKTAWRRNS